MRVAALDVGERRVGFALADPTGSIVSKTGVFDRPEDAREGYKALADLVREYTVDTLVVGYPVSLSGQAGAQARRVEAFVEGLRAHFQSVGIRCRLVLWDERLSTVVAEGYLREMAMGRERRDKGRVDSLAAGVILESYLDRRARTAQGADEYSEHP